MTRHRQTIADLAFTQGYQDAVHQIKRGHSAAYLQHCATYPGLDRKYREGFLVAVAEFMKEK